jgi:hypothetical protein
MAGMLGGTMTADELEEMASKLDKLCAGELRCKYKAGRTSGINPYRTIDRVELTAPAMQTTSEYLRWLAESWRRRHGKF